MLRRWRDRSCEGAARARGITFEGCRLPPGTFQLLNACKEAGWNADAPVTTEALRPFYAAAREKHPTWRAPNVDNVVALIAHLQGRGCLDEVLNRPRSAANPGLPDLFLWQRTRDGKRFGGRFVEVKRSTERPKFREPESVAQRDERVFLSELGFKAQVRYLIQR